MRVCTRGIAALLAGVLAAGCTPGFLNGDAPQGAVDEAVEIVWPAAPETPRIRYLHSLASERDLGARPGLFKRFVRFLQGRKAESLARPHGLAVDDEQRLYVVDTLQRRVHVFDRAQGRHYVFPETPPQGFVNPIGVATGTDGRVYISDAVTKVIHVFSAHGGRYEGALGAGLFERPTGLAFDAVNRRLLVTDTVASTLMALEEWPPSAEKARHGASAIESTVTARWEGEGDERLHGPTHVAIDREGAIAVSDSLNFRVRLLDGDFTPQQAFGAPGKRPGYFSRPKGIALDSAGHVYVVDALFGNVQIFNAQGQLLLAFGRPGTGPGEFWLPSDIHIDQADRIYVADTWNQRVQVFQYLHQEAL